MQDNNHDTYTYQVPSGNDDLYASATDKDKKAAKTETVTKDVGETSPVRFCRTPGWTESGSASSS